MVVLHNQRYNFPDGFDCQVRGLLWRPLLFVGDEMIKKPMRTNIYIDGFNLYYGQLRGTPHKWLDPVQLFKLVLAPQNQINKVKYFTARVQPTPSDVDVHIRQDAYFRALEAHCPQVALHYGHFLRHKVRMENAQPPPATWPVWKTEEKGSDVNLALHILNDAWQNAFDCAVIVSNDSDLCESMNLVKQHHPDKTLGLITPGAPNRKTSQQLAIHADFKRSIRGSALAASQLPNPIPGTTITKPATW
jgi:hypothetical protein